MQDSMVSNRFIIGIVAFGVSFGLTLVVIKDFGSAFFTGFMTILATYTATFFVNKTLDQKRRNYELQTFDSFRKKINELEKIQQGISLEVNQLEAARHALHAESNQLQNQVSDRRNQRDSLNRELSTFALQKKQLESEVIHLQDEIKNIEKSKEEANKSFTNISAEKRRLELNCNVSKSEITQLHAKIGELLQEREELENNLTLLNRLKPQLEEKLYELRVQVQELESEQNKQKQLLSSRNQERESLVADLELLQTQKQEEKQQLQQLQEQISLLKEERDLLQSQVWELLQQLENLNQEPSVIQAKSAEETEEFPFSDLFEAIATEPIETMENTSEELLQEWNNFRQSLAEYEIQVLKSILDEENPNSIIKRIAQEQITMPNLLIDSINERAKDIIGELIISSNNETPQIFAEYQQNIQRLISIFEALKN